MADTAQSMIQDVMEAMKVYAPGVTVNAVGHAIPDASEVDHHPGAFTR